MQRSELIVSALGPSAPIRMLGGATDADKAGPNSAAAYMLSPSIWTHLSTGATLTYQWEVTSDLPDQNGNWPSPGNWVPYANPATGLQQVASAFQNTTIMFTAIRVNVVAYTSGTATFRVLQ